MKEVHFHDHTLDAETAGFPRILVTERDPPYAGASSAAGQGPDYQHAFTH